MLRLLKLRFSGIGRFQDEQEVPFSELGRLVQVDGLNEATGGSSGSGKSTIFQAYEYLLGLNDTPATVLQARNTKNKIKVEGEFDWDGKSMTVHRSAARGLVVTVDGDEKSGSNALAEERLDKALGMPRKLFRMATHKRQGEGGFFLSLPPKECHKFVVDCLDLNHLLAQQTSAENKLKANREALSKAESDEGQARSALEAAEQALASLPLPPKPTMHQEIIDQMEATAAASLVALGGRELAYKKWESTLVYSTVEAVPYDDSGRAADREKLTMVRDRLLKAREAFTVQKKELVDRIQAIRQEVEKKRDELIEGAKALAAEARTHDQMAAKLDSAASKRSEKEAQLAALDNHRCDRCNQVWIGEQATAEAEAIRASLPKFDEAKQRADAARVHYKTLLAQSEDLYSQAKDTDVNKDPRYAELIAQMDMPIPENMLKLEEAARLLEASIEKHRVLNQEHDRKEYARIQADNRARMDLEAAERKKLQDETSQARGQYDVNRRAVEAARNQLRNEQSQREHSEAARKASSEIVAKKASLLTSATLNTMALRKGVAVGEEAVRLVRSYTGAAFDGALEEISENASRVLAQLPNTSTMTIKLSSTRETKDGKVKEEITALLSMDGEPDIDLRSLCGGEGSAAHLAIDMAVVDLIESRGGKGCDILALDEPFDGMDPQTKERCLDVIKASGTKKRVLVVDHTPEIKQMVDQSVFVTRPIGKPSVVSVR